MNPAVTLLKKEIRASIKTLSAHMEGLQGTGCTFWACDGWEHGRIKSMVTCSICQTIIQTGRTVNRLKKQLRSL